MSVQTALGHLARREDIPAACMRAAMQQIMNAEVRPEQAAAMLMGLVVKGETSAELTAAAEVMREHAVPVSIPLTGDADFVLDTCGTGGDGSRIFNVSTAAAFVCAEAGIKVAKHGNRSVSSTSGSADVLEAAGLRLDLQPQQVASCVQQLNIGFLYARAHHPAVARVAEVRQALGLRTMFNLLGPLTNPAAAPCQLLGVYAARWLQPVAQTLQRLGSRHVMVVHAEDGLDEISCASNTLVTELRDGSLHNLVIEPEQYLGQRRSLDALQVADAHQSLALIEQALRGSEGAAADIVALNAGAGIYVADRADSLQSGYRLAREILASGKAWQRLQQLVELSQALAATAADGPHHAEAGSDS
ncbi:MAG: anthranilate phosphoribosyltransferase [Gammaproteobacteria bacterium]|nr:anthranilate phosphoribosyltransferase [Gammaproteobacteria bacterium]